MTLCILSYISYYESGDFSDHLVHESVLFSAPLWSASPAPAVIYIPMPGLLLLSPAAPRHLPEVTAGSVVAAG